MSSASSQVPNPGAVPVPVDPGPHPHVWVQRFFMVIQVLLFIETGLVLVVLPWKLPDIWLNNVFVMTRPGLRDFLANYFVRGIISGLGLIDIWIGISTAVHYRDRK